MDFFEWWDSEVEDNVTSNRAKRFAKAAWEKQEEFIEAQNLEIEELKNKVRALELTVMELSGLGDDADEIMN